jgi:hypothetical protein
MIQTLFLYCLSIDERSIAGVCRGRVGRCFTDLIGRFGVGWDIAALNECRE